MKTSIKLLGGIAAAALMLTACEDASDAGDYTETTAKTEAPADVTTPEAPQMTIVGLAAGNEDLSTLVAAVTAAELVDTLNSGGPFTVFGPPNSAFAKLPAGTVETLVKPENKGTLTGILTYHVVSGEVMAADLIAAIGDNGGSYTVPTVNGQNLTATIVDGGVVLTDAKGGTSNVIATDIDASNGVVHLVDTVLMPN